MKITTKLFGNINIAEEKIILFLDGIIGFPEMKRFTIIVDEEKKDSKIFWLQSMDEGNFAMPVLDPYLVHDNYNPVIEDELLKSLGDFTEDDLTVLVTLNVQPDITNMYVNLKAPILINSKEKKACQVITEDDAYPVRFPVYDILKKKKEEAGD